jgi:two-component system, chemotaxis family, chemotaxis protein CheY
MKILVVDDLLENRKLLSTLLKSIGQCDTADEGQSAVDMFEGEIEEGVPYDIILLDIAMPIMDGQEALKQMRKIEKEKALELEKPTPIIMVTAVDAKAEVAEAFESGCTDYINKPISKAKLFTKLSALGLIPSDWFKENL